MRVARIARTQRECVHSVAWRDEPSLRAVTMLVRNHIGTIPLILSSVAFRAALTKQN